MSLFSTLNTGASGLGASSLGLSVIGDNIANLGTTAYKSSGAAFADMLPQTIGGLAGTSQLGTGVIGNSVNTLFSQGSIESSSSSLDVALSGGGFFQVADGSDAYYTRDGSFFLDDESNLVTASGLNVQGYQAEGGNLSTVVGDLQIDAGPLPPQQTSTVSMDIELSPAFDGSDDLSGAALDGASETIEEIADTVDFATSVTIYDSLGQPHDMTLLFEKIGEGPDEWAWSAVVDAGEAGVGADGVALEIAEGSMQFDADGQLDPASFSQTLVSSPVFGSAAPFEFTLDLGADGAGSIVQTAESEDGEGSSTLIGVDQDGYASGQLSSVEVQEDGTLLGRYDNGEELVLGQLAIASFSAEGGLARLGGNLYGATLASGEAALGVAGEGGRGSTVGYALEGSNVDLEDEFVSMIETQRAYQANADVIRAADETLQELVNLV